MFDFDSLKTAKKSAGVNQEKQQETFENLLAEANQIFKDFEKDQSVEKLERAAEKFADCLKYKSTSLEPYYALAVIFSLIGKVDMAMEYFIMVKGMDPNYPGLQKMMNYIIENSKALIGNEEV
jgi:tetratricopeptide (TPR) repeat protein